MATKKYLSLDEASQELGLPNDQVVKLREQGRLRGFADRGTWKFKADDVEEYARSRQADSSPDVPLIDDEEDSVLTGQSGERLGTSSIMASSSIMSDDPSEGGDEPTVIRGDASGSAVFDEEPILSSSDSDVRLYRDSSVSKIDSSPEVSLQRESDSDVRLVDEKQGKSPSGKSDSDVRLAGDEEDVETVSDVRLLSDADQATGASGSDSDVALVSGSGKTGGSVFDEDDGTSATADSGIALESIADSGIALDSTSGSQNIQNPASGITLADSGVAAGSSIVSLSEDSGIALEALNEGGGGRSDATEADMNASGEESEFELAAGNEVASGDDTSVILFDDDESSFEVVSPSGKQQPASNEFGDSVVELGDDYDEFDDAGSSVVMGDVDDDMEFEAADEDFDDGFQTGESAADFAAPAQRVAVAPEPEIGGWAFAGLALSSVLLAVCGLMMFDLVRSIWGYHEPTVSSALLDSMKGLL